MLLFTTKELQRQFLFFKEQMGDFELFCLNSSYFRLFRNLSSFHQRKTKTKTKD
jgi:hypothetical protein